MKLILIVAIFLTSIAAVPIAIGNFLILNRQIGITESIVGKDIKRDKDIVKDKTPKKDKEVTNKDTEKIKMLKDVGEAYMENFGLTEQDFKIMKDANVNVIEGNFDICASDEDVQNFLDQSSKHGIKVIMPAGAGEAEWGYECDQERYPSNQKPVWNKEEVVEWINKWKTHPALYGWDTSNEAGSVFPNPSEDNMLTQQQLKQAYTDVKEADPDHPVMIRMNGWYFYDYENNFFREGNPFAKDVADIVMVNAYSNVDEYFDDFVTTVTDRALSSIHQTDPDVSIIVSLGTWKEPPIWTMPTVQHLKDEISQLKQYDEVSGIAYFKYGAKESEWYLPDSATGAPDLLNVISQE